jgi:hypothetical protein
MGYLWCTTSAGTLLLEVYIPIFILLVYTILQYRNISIFLRDKAKEIGLEEAFRTKSLIGYPLITLIFWIPPFIKNLCDWMQTEYSQLLTIAYVVCLHSQGAVNALYYMIMQRS